MSKKQISNRLDKLFEEIKEEEEVTKRAPRSSKKTAQPSSQHEHKEGIASASFDYPKTQESEALKVQVDRGDSYAAMSLPVRTDEESWANLRVVDNTPHREWDIEEQLLVQQVSDQLELALRNAYLFQETEQRNEELNVLNEIIRSASESLNLEESLAQVLKKTIDVLQVDAGLISTVDPTQDELVLSAWQSLPESVLENIQKNGLEDTPCGYVYQTQSPLILPDFKEENAPLDISGLIENGLVAYLGFPLLARDEIVGTLCLFHSEPLYLTAEDTALLNSIGRQVGFSVQNARLFQEAQRRTEELALINKVTVAVSSSLNMDESLQIIAKEVVQISNALHIGVTLLDEEEENLVLTMDYPQTSDIGLKISLENNPTSNQVLETHAPLVLTDVQNNPLTENIKDVMKMRGTESLTIFPILVGKKAIGTIGIDFASPFETLSQNQVDLIQTILLQASASIETARLFTKTQESEQALQRQNEYMAAAAEVGRLVTETLDQDILFRRAVNLLQEHFGYYHAAIFTIEETGFNAVLQEATGETGREMKKRKHQLGVGSESVVGQATESEAPYIVNDVTKDSKHHPNPLLPETKSEAAIPLTIGRRILGAIDLQSTKTDAFSEDDIAVLQILANQFATAIDNARSYQLAQESFEKMRELEKLKSQFLANMSHELRTPLNSIIGFSRVILKGIDGPVTNLQEQDLTAIYNSGQHLLGLINDILDLSKLEAGKMEMTFDEVDIEKLIRSVMSTVVGLIKDKPVRLEEEIEENLPPVKADSMRIRQVLINFFSNAAKFTEEGVIKVMAKSKGGVVRVSVTDSGPGISEEDREKLFQAFSQVDASATRATGGSGLGLSISKELVTMHDGDIGMESKVGEGSTFYFTLPFFYPPEEDAAENEGAEERYDPDKPKQEDDLVILAIDDDEKVIQLYERYLNKQGYRVVPLTDPKKAVERALELTPYAITLDIMMPNYDGWQVLEDLKSNPETQKFPTIICSIVADTQKGYALGATDYLLKPIIEDDLLQSLNRIGGQNEIHEILIIDDDPDDLRLLEKMLEENKNYVPIIANTGPAGWDKMVNSHPQAVLLDLFMPEMGGFEIIDAMQEYSTLKDIPVIVISGGDISKTQQEKLDALNHHLLKKGSLSADELADTLERSLKRLAKPNTNAKERK